MLKKPSIVAVTDTDQRSQVERALSGASARGVGVSFLAPIELKSSAGSMGESVAGAAMLLIGPVGATVDASAVVADARRLGFRGPAILLSERVTQKPAGICAVLPLPATPATIEALLAAVAGGGGASVGDSCAGLAGLALAAS
jgi:hypothetical protein